MSELIDWSKAPEGATQYVVGSIRPWERIADGRLSYFNGGEWFALPMRDGSGEMLIVERPTTPQWSGEGLPPVGVVCMAGCEQVVIVAHHCNGIHAIYAESESDGLLYYGEPNEFRPIRTPEQIAADEREAAIAEMTASYADNFEALAGWAAYVYDTLGYRKP